MQNRKKLVSLGILAVSAALAFAALYLLPVKVAILDNSPDENLTTFGGIKKSQPLEMCMSRELNFETYRDVNFEFLLATFARTNTSHYNIQFYDLKNGEKAPINEETFDASGIKDNSFKSFDLKPQDSKITRLCFKLTSPDATDGNAITVWLNGRGEPVIKVTAYTDLMNLIKEIAGLNAFSLGEVTVLGLFFIYLVSIAYLAGYLLTHHDAEKETSKSAHHQRTHRRRI